MNDLAGTQIQETIVKSIADMLKTYREACSGWIAVQIKVGNVGNEDDSLRKQGRLTMKSASRAEGRQVPRELGSVNT
jgi:hypothetical protein